MSRRGEKKNKKIYAIFSSFKNVPFNLLTSLKTFFLRSYEPLSPSLPIKPNMMANIFFILPATYAILRVTIWDFAPWLPTQEPGENVFFQQFLREKLAAIRTVARPLISTFELAIKADGYLYHRTVYSMYRFASKQDFPKYCFA